MAGQSDVDVSRGQNPLDGDPGKSGDFRVGWGSLRKPGRATEVAVMSGAAVPWKLRATDVVKHVVNVDSRFRDNPVGTEAADFYFSLLSPVRNVLRVRVTSVEFPNNYKFFTAGRRNVTLRFLWLDGGGATQSTLLMIADGNYTAGDMVDALTAVFEEARVGGVIPFGVTVNFSEVTGQFTFDASGTRFGIEPAAGGWPDRDFDYGLAYYLGFSRQRLHRSVAVSGGWRLESDQCANFAGDNYLFLRVNDFACVRQTVAKYQEVGGVRKADLTDFTALAKLVLREPKNYMTFDDYGSQHAKEVVFPAPVDLTRLRIQVLDVYGEVVDMCSMQFSFSLEVLEVRNPAIYNAVRDQLVGGALTGRGAAGGVVGP